MPNISQTARTWLVRASFCWLFLLGHALFAQEPLNAAALASVPPHSSDAPTPIRPVLPITTAKTLSGRKIVLPAPRRLTLIVASFNRGGSRARNDWWGEANSLCARHAVLDCYETAVAGEISRAIPRLAAEEWKRAVPDAAWDRFAVLNAHTTMWKKALGASGSARAYAMLLAPDGVILWQAAGSKGDSLPPGLEQALLDNDF